MRNQRWSLNPELFAWDFKVFTDFSFKALLEDGLPGLISDHSKWLDYGELEDHIDPL